MMEYTGQLIGGPDDGNIITSTLTHVQFEQITRHWLDGYGIEPVFTRVRGRYVWNELLGVFEWEKKA